MMISKRLDKSPIHVRNYYKVFGYDESSVILCELCSKPGNQIHHVIPRSSFGSKRKDEQDHVSNLVCLCFECHEKAHGPLSNWYKGVFLTKINLRK